LGTCCGISTNIPPFDLYQLLENYGPLWVASNSPDPHVRVITGIEGDGTADGSVLDILDPLERGMKFLNPSNSGSSYSETFRQFEIEQNSLQQKGMTLTCLLLICQIDANPLFDYRMVIF
jgi:hypothetical protein